MSDAEKLTQTILVELEDKSTIYFEVTQAGGREDVAFGAKTFRGVLDSIEGLAKDIESSIKKACPTKATAKFGLEIEVKQGNLIAAIIQGASKSNLEITLEWDYSSKIESSNNQLKGEDHESKT